MSTEMPYRLFIINDASTDGTTEWLTKYADTYNVHKTITLSQRHGIAKTTNVGVSSTQSDPFVWGNDDFYWKPKWDTECLRLLRDYPNAGIVSSFRLNVTAPNKNKVVALEINDQGTPLVVSLPIHGGAWMVRRQAWIDGEGFSLPEDKFFGFVVSPFCKKIGKKGWQVIFSTRGLIEHMDDLKHPLSERVSYKEYDLERRKYKSNKYKT